MSFDDYEDLSVVEDAMTITEYYKDKVILLTGFTGFIGKVLVEKLLWSCPDLKVIYVLVRKKKGKSIEQRIKEVTDLMVFDRLRERGDAFIEKIVGIEGECTLPELGLSEVDKEALMSVNVIIHSAASVRFDDPLHEAINVNTRSLKRLLDLALQMKRLECVVPLSTAYVNCHIKDGSKIEEKIYPLSLDWRQALKDSEVLDPALLATLSYKYMDGMPNTYVFTKRISEHIVESYSDKIMCCIVRPTIVVMCLEEPLNGWLDNLNGPVGLVIGFATGVVRTSLLKKDILPDYIPADYISKFVLVMPWWMKYRKYPRQLEIFNAGSSDGNSMTIQEVLNIGKSVVKKYPLKKCIWKPSIHSTDSKFIFTFYSFLFQLLPSIVIDMLLKFIGQKPLLQKIQIRIYNALMTISYFTLNFFYFSNEKPKIVGQFIKKDDFDHFYYYKDIVDNYSTFENALPLGKRVLLKEGEEEEKIAMLRMKIMNFIDSCVKILFWVYIFWTVYKCQLCFVIPRMIYNSIIHVIFVEDLFSLFLAS